MDFCEFSKYFTNNSIPKDGENNSMDFILDEIANHPTEYQNEIETLKPKKSKYKKRKITYGKQIKMNKENNERVTVQNEKSCIVYGGEIVLKTRKTSIKYGLDINNNNEFTVEIRKLGINTQAVYLNDKNFDMMAEKKTCIAEQLNKIVNRQTTANDSKYLFVTATFECATKMYKEMLHVMLKERQSCETGSVFGTDNAKMSILKDDFEHLLELIPFLHYEKSILLKEKSQIMAYVDLYRCICSNLGVGALEIDNCFEPIDMGNKTPTFDYKKLFFQLSMAKNVIHE